VAVYLTTFGSACEGSISPPLFSQGATPITNAVVNQTVPAAESCAQCHEEVVAQWSLSRHAISHSNPNFLAAVAEAPQREWCLNCHLPIRAGKETSSSPPRGVTCAVCHIREDALLVAKPLSEWGRSEHPNAVVNPTLSSSSFCAGCHQFVGPTNTHPVAFQGDPVQDTFGEWSRSPEPRESCQQCHMPDGKHTFYGGHHLATLQSALEVTTHGRELTIATTPRVSHAVPTGDPFRRLVLRFCGPTCDTAVKTYTFAVIHTYVDGVIRVTKDTRLQANTSRQLPVPEDASGWELWYYYADPRLAEHLPDHEVSMRVATGVFEALVSPPTPEAKTPTGGSQSTGTNGSFRTFPFTSKAATR